MTHLTSDHPKTGGSRSRLAAIAVLVLAMSASADLAAKGLANFYVTNESGQHWSLKCDGPLSRFHGVSVEVGDTNKLWYSPGESIFFTGPWGKWTCGIAPDSLCDNPQCSATIGCCCCYFGSSGVVEGEYECPSVVELCLADDPDPDVSFTITASGELTSNGAPLPCNDALTTASTLGFEGSSNTRDQDFYEFDGQAGDEVTITLELDTRVGKTGELATLVFDDGDKLKEKTTGALPLELRVTIPEDGTYRVTITNGKVNRNVAFAGGYRLRFHSANDAVDEIRPHDPRTLRKRGRRRH